MINQIVDGILSHLYDLIHAFFTSFHIVIDPVYEWWAFGVLFFLACAVIGWFLPFKWVRATLFGAVVLVGAFLAGGTKMHKEDEADEAARAKARQKTRKPVAKAPPASSIFPWW